jgi:hypothetical protein
MLPLGPGMPRGPGGPGDKFTVTVLVGGGAEVEDETAAAVAKPPADAKPTAPAIMNI